MNKEKVRKHIIDIQIAIGKILEEMEGFESVARESFLKDYHNLDEKTVELTDELGISREEASTINDILSRTEPRQVDIEELIEDETEEEALARVKRECGIVD